MILSKHIQVKKNETKVMKEKILNGTKHAVIFADMDEIHWYDFDAIREDGGVQGSILGCYSVFFDKYLSQEEYKDSFDKRNHYTKYAKFLSKTYEMHEAYKDNSETICKTEYVFNGEDDVVYCFLKKEKHFYDFDAIIERQKEDPEYFTDFSTVEDEYRRVFPQIYTEPSIHYETRLKYYFYLAYVELKLYQNDEVEEEDMLYKYVINGEIDEVMISETVIHCYDFNEIRVKNLFPKLQERYINFYGRLFPKTDDKDIKTYHGRLTDYFKKFEKAYLQYLNDYNSPSGKKKKISSINSESSKKKKQEKVAYSINIEEFVDDENINFINYIFTSIEDGQETVNEEFPHTANLSDLNTEEEEIDSDDVNFLLDDKEKDTSKEEEFDYMEANPEPNLMFVNRVQTDKRKIDFEKSIEMYSQSIPDYEKKLNTFFKGYFKWNSELFDKLFRSWMNDEILVDLPTFEKKILNVKKNSDMDSLMDSMIKKEFNLLGRQFNYIPESKEFILKFRLFGNDELCLMKMKFGQFLNFIRTTVKLTTSKAKYEEVKKVFATTDTLDAINKALKEAKNFKIGYKKLSVNCRIEKRKNSVEENKYLLQDSFCIVYYNEFREKEMLPVFLDKPLKQQPQYFEKLRVDRKDDGYYAVLTYRHAVEEACPEQLTQSITDLKEFCGEKVEVTYNYFDSYLTINFAEDVSKSTIKKAQKIFGKDLKVPLDIFDIFYLKAILAKHFGQYEKLKKSLQFKETEDTHKSKAYIEIYNRIIQLQFLIQYVLNEVAYQISVNYDLSFKVKFTDTNELFNLVSDDVQKAIKKRGFTCNTNVILFGIKKCNQLYINVVDNLYTYLAKLSSQFTRIHNNVKRKNNTFLFGKKDKKFTNKPYLSPLAKKYTFDDPITT